MKKLLLILMNCVFIYSNAQFKINFRNELPTTSYLYGYTGSKEILLGKSLDANKKEIVVNKAYTGFLRLYFPSINQSISLIAENKNVELEFTHQSEKISNVKFFDEVNVFMSKSLDQQKKLEVIFPVLLEMKEYYKADSNFGNAINNEIAELEGFRKRDFSQFPFINYYFTNYNRFMVNDVSRPPLVKEDYIQFLDKSNDFLETSNLLKLVLINFIKISNPKDIDQDIDHLMSILKTDSPRGQTVLSEIIEIFSSFGLEAQKQKYLNLAKNLKCSINERLTSTLEKEKNTQIGAKATDLLFHNAKNTTAKSLFQVKANRKVLMFWSSTCSHCEKEIPEVIKYYNEMKSKNIEVIGLSLDSEKEAYYKVVNQLPWINVSELKGWNSSYAEVYNISSTPSFYILDEKNTIIAKPNHFSDVIRELNIK